MSLFRECFCVSCNGHEEDLRWYGSIKWSWTKKGLECKYLLKMIIKTMLKIAVRCAPTKTGWEQLEDIQTELH